MSTNKDGLSLLRKPFDKNQISKLPKPTKQQTEAVRADYRAGIRCQLCGAWHHKDVVHLDYVGHAALTDRLLDCDPEWNWEPLSIDDNGQPIFKDGGLWIKLTVCGVTRLGFGDAEGKTGPNSIKEMIGDALRNAAMRFGAALDLWHKGDLHAEDAKEEQPPPMDRYSQAKDPFILALKNAKSLTALGLAWQEIPRESQQYYVEIKDQMKVKLTPKKPEAA